ncbi:polyketide synthase [Legionella cherrii]|uniref:beta-ketoacyl [acyl carrier protein] synthase domain-containing protein n=1 Tax=Legionella cherrii TaxID=28084 RepID=UPI0024158FED|nr:polyketide synthase [Legionella cherrii]
MNDTTTLKKSLLMIQKLKKLLQEQNEKSLDPVAIIGMSCRLPAANTPQEFWELLCQGKNVISPIPNERWELLKGTREPEQRDANLPYWGGYLQQIEAFDAYFFGISPREAMRMDPQQRILMEVAYESLEDAGLTVETLAGSNMGVFPAYTQASSVVYKSWTQIWMLCLFLLEVPLVWQPIAYRIYSICGGLAWY